MEEKGKSVEWKICREFSFSFVRINLKMIGPIYFCYTKISSMSKILDVLANGKDLYWFWFIKFDEFRYVVKFGLKLIPKMSKMFLENELKTAEKIHKMD